MIAIELLLESYAKFFKIYGTLKDLVWGISIQWITIDKE